MLHLKISGCGLPANRRCGERHHAYGSNRLLANSPGWLRRL